METDEVRFGTKELTVSELFDEFYGTGLPPDPTPSQVRTRLIFLGRKYREMEYERTVSQLAHGRRHVGIWNNIRSLIDRELKVTEGINISICSEARLSNIGA